MRKAQNLSIYSIIIIILAVVVIAVLILYATGVISQGRAGLGTFFHIGGNVTENATKESLVYRGL